MWEKLKIIIEIVILLLFLVFVYSIFLNRMDTGSNTINYVNNFVGMSIVEAQKFGSDNDIEIITNYEYNSEILKDIIISQNIKEGTKLDDIDKIEIVVSKGKINYQEYGVNELGKVPIMMYHGIVNMKSSDTEYIGGNVDKNGYNRTSEAFRNDLEFYYDKGYRMIRLNDYVDGNIDVELGYSPIILTFDDGNKNNFNVLGKDDEGELIIDPECAVGILEEFKKKYPDYGVTATFFVNSSLFEQDEYNEEILKWLVSHGYDIGNHTLNHVDFTGIDSNKTMKEVGGLYEILEDIIPGKYVNILALPFGSPYNKEHSNYPYILKGSYNNYQYKTKAALRVGWEAELSCYHKDFDPTFLKRIRAYDNNGLEFDIEMNFKILEKSRYISDGIIDTIVIKKEDKDSVIDTNKKVISY